MKKWDIAINYGIKTGYNEAFIIDTAKKDEILANCDDSDKSRKPIIVSKGRGNPQNKNIDCHELISSRNDKTPCHTDLSFHTDTPCHTDLSCHTEHSEVSKNLSHCHTEHSEVSKNKGVDSSLSTKAQNDKADCHADKSACSIVMLTERERTAKLIKPILRGRDIKRYSYEWAGLWLINTHNGYTSQNGEQIPAIDINDYPALKKHLDSFYPKLEKRADKGKMPYNLRNCAYIDEFEKEKIIYPETSQGAYFMYGNTNIFLEKTSFMIISKKLNTKFLLGLLNSALITFYFKNFCGGCILGNNAYQYNKHALEKLPIPKITKESENLANEIINSVSEILALKAENSGTDISRFEKIIDNLVYKLYNLDKNEIQIIQGQEK